MYTIVDRLRDWYEWLVSDPLGFVIYLVYFSVAILITLILHEVAHGYVAYRCGDPTAKMMGRLSLNPAKHLDPIGTICLVFLGFGWAKPVPVNPRNYRRGVKDDILVSIAGVVTNLILFLLATALSIALNGLLWKPEIVAYYGTEQLVSSVGYLAKSNAGVMQYPWLMYVQRFLIMLASMNICIAVFNILPIPPLDGYHLLNDVVFKGRLSLNATYANIARVALLALCLTGLLGTLLSTVVGWAQTGVIRLFLLIAGLQ